jgi:lipopolysaccharide/colanic/teichoic acid biosynthesis glycosyltransferase
VSVSRSRRALDVAAAGGALVVLSPLLALCAALVRLETPGPALFRQTRVGEGGRPFTMLKFRSMRVDAAGPSVTVPGDRRVTRTGAFLRATSLDELPQLVNVLRGDMTLVGPRPEVPELAAKYPTECQVVFAFRPGLTGPAQVHHRDDAVLPPAPGAHDAVAVDGDALEQHYLYCVVPQRVEADLGYLRAPTLRRTLAVLVETVRYLAGQTPAAGPSDSSARVDSGVQRPFEHSPVSRSNS